MDNENVSSFVSNPIEPDLSAAMVQGIVNPAELVGTHGLPQRLEQAAKEGLTLTIEETADEVWA